VTVIGICFVQALLPVEVTVYVRVPDGEATTTAPVPVVGLKLVTGVHAYDVPLPLAVKVTDPVPQMSPDLVTATVGAGFTVTATVPLAVLEQASVTVNVYVVVPPGGANVTDAVVPTSDVPLLQE
jgi:hypothetical protein